jgi:hypothetical protein
MLSGVASAIPITRRPAKSSKVMEMNYNINLTMSRYTHILRGQTAKANESLPKIDIAKQKQVKTGTDNTQENLTSNLTRNSIKFKHFGISKEGRYKQHKLL